jgi:hypothetical protein
METKIKMMKAMRYQAWVKAAKQQTVIGSLSLKK